MKFNDNKSQTQRTFWTESNDSRINIMAGRPVSGIPVVFDDNDTEISTKNEIRISRKFSKIQMHFYSYARGTRTHR